MGQATPRPWVIERSSTGSGVAIAVRGADGRDVYARAIGFSSANEANANTDLIVQAVNCHDEMLNALRAALAVVLSADPDKVPRLAERRALVEAAIARAEGR